jgi:hypothetical protein
MAEMINESAILKAYPELSWIKEEALRKKCCVVLMEACLIGGWDTESMYQIPVSVSKVLTPSLLSAIDHVRVVTRIAASIYDSLEGTYRMQGCYRDTIVAGALLHDLGKPMEFARLCCAG